MPGTAVERSCHIRYRLVLLLIPVAGLILAVWAGVSIMRR
jgi:hypothetical protein